MLSQQNEFVVTKKLSIFFFLIKRINLKAEHELSCFITCHLGEIEASHKLMESH